MHELSLVEAIIEILQGEEKLKNGAAEIGLKVGALRQVQPDIMEFCFKAAADGTVFENARLVIEEVPIVRLCKNCNNKWQDCDFYSSCPSCQSPETEMLSGMELDIEYVKIS